MNVIDRKTLKSSTQGGTESKRSSTDQRYHQGSHQGMAPSAKNVTASLPTPIRRKP